MQQLEYVRARMQELKPQIDDLSKVDGALNDEQRTAWTRVTSEWNELDERRKDLEERERMAAAAGSINFNVVKQTNPLDDAAPLDSRNLPEMRDRARAAVDKVAKRFAQTSHGDAVMKLIERGDGAGDAAAALAITTGSDAYREAWLKAMSGRFDYDARLLERANDEYRAMTAGTGNTGGFMVPLYLDPTMILTGAGSYNPIRQVANVKQINTLTYNGASAAQISAGLLGENSAFSDNAPTVGQIQIPTYKIGAYIPASFEAFEDIGALAQDAAELFMDAKDNYEATQFATGSGSAPNGVVADVAAVTASRVSSATGGTYAVADVYSIHQGLPARFRWRGGASRAWMANVKVIDSTRQFATSNNYHAFLTDLAGGQPSQLLGDPLFEASTMSSSLTTGQDVLLYGDFSRFYIIDRIGTSTEFIPNVVDGSGLPTGTRAWLMHWRVGSDTVDPNAFRVLRL